MSSRNPRHRWSVILWLATALPLFSEVPKQTFRTSEFLTSCTGFVDSQELAIAMDTQCVSQASRFCEYTVGADRLEACVRSATLWLEAEAKKLRLSADEMGMADLVDQALKSASDFDSDLFGLPAKRPDCALLNEPNVSRAVLCAYTNSLFDWIALRVVFRTRIAGARSSPNSQD